MPKLDQDQLGIGSFALAEPSLFTEVIADGHHLPVEAIKTIAAAKGDKMVAVTDAISATGMPDGDYVLGGLNVTSSQGAARLTGKTTLAGSTLTMDRAFDFLVNQVGITLEQAVVATSTAPAQVLLRKDLGTIEIGARADLVLWNDGVKQVWKNGTLI
jgi:N-acetylglucosamine-6-phosphate deacetylase